MCPQKTVFAHLLGFSTLDTRIDMVETRNVPSTNWWQWKPHCWYHSVPSGMVDVDVKNLKILETLTEFQFYVGNFPKIVVGHYLCIHTFTIK